jgi:feruloyl esterase
MSNGTKLFPGLPVGSEVLAPTQAGPRSGWDPWIVRDGQATVSTLFGETFLKNLAFTTPNANYDWTTFDFDRDPPRMAGIRNVLEATDPDLTKFRARGGKILMYFGWADPALNPLMGIGYYENVRSRMGAATPEFFRLFMVPGMFHCGGGVGVGDFDAITPLVSWVEKGTAPSRLTGTRIVDGKAVRTRPLCPYPEAAKYTGTGSVDDAANFVCRAQ